MCDGIVVAQGAEFGAGSGGRLAWAAPVHLHNRAAWCPKQLSVPVKGAKSLPYYTISK